MWNDGTKVKVVMYNGSNMIEAEAIERGIQKMIELKTRMPFSDEENANNYMIATLVKKCVINDESYQVIMHGIVKEVGDEK